MSEDNLEKTKDNKDSLQFPDIKDIKVFHTSIIICALTDTVYLLVLTFAYLPQVFIVSTDLDQVDNEYYIR